ncbi:MAG TPA: HAMP domain-containing sensor histidine kinase [Actinomycetota bacterium]|nr:HAMP domain-containing sensor histidine kinase [Actinomycetota bacterium]
MPERPAAGPRIRWGVRSRILAWYVALMAGAIAASVLVVRTVLTNQLDARIDAALAQEANELRKLARGRDPETGERFRGDVERIFAVFLERNIPARNEVILTFVGGEPFRRSRPVSSYRLHRQPELVERWNDIPRVDRGTIEGTPAGRIEYLAVPVKEGRQVRGVFVGAIFRDLELAELDPALWGAIGVGLATLLVGSLLAWRVAEGVLRPVGAVTRAAQSISEGDLSRRIDVTGRDEVAELARTFNEMLDRLEEAFATQRRFVDDAGHELRTPITVIRGHLELLEEDPVERRVTLDLVMDELQRMQRIVDDLLTLAKAEQPDFLDLDTVELEQLIREVHAKSEAIGPREWRLERVARGRVVADRQRLTQALIQLAQNAVQHTDEGALIGLGSALTGGEARLWVRDTGPGIDPQHQVRIFRRFARTGVRRSDGAGIGLSVVKAIAEAHHGRVEVDSRPGAGATFSVVIPADQPVQEEV